MKPQELGPRDVERCEYRRATVAPDGGESATCGLLEALLGDREGGSCAVGRDVCVACCRSGPASPQSLNPVVASLVYARALRLSAAVTRRAEAERLRQLGERARTHLDIVYREPLSLPRPGAPVAAPLDDLVPPPAVRRGPRVRDWAVGVTTAPRVRPVLEPCLGSLVRAGWERPTLFIDSAVRIPERFAHLPCSFREEQVGAWPSYLLALTELLLRSPRADAYMVVQDDALFFDQETLPRYLEGVLWPGKGPALVSLYCNAADSADGPGWHVGPALPSSGPVALVFPRALAKAFVTDRGVFEHRWDPDEVAATAIGDLISLWAHAHGLPMWFPTPSLVQHIGDTSTLWPSARASGPRRASRFVGEEAGVRRGS